MEKPVDIWYRESYLMSKYGDRKMLKFFSTDTDDSEEHIILVIAEYKRQISVWDTACEDIYGHLCTCRKGLEIEEGLLKNIQSVNNSAKSARVKK